MTITFIAAALVGVFIGLMSGLLGVGGGTIMVPMYRLAFGMSAVASTATSLFTIIPTSISGIITHVRNKTCLPKLGLVLGLGGACTSPLGVWLATISPSWAIMVVAALAIGYSAFSIMRKAIVAPRNQQPRAGESAIERPDFTFKQLAVGFAIGLATGAISGYIGLGGGFLMVPLMLTFIGVPMKLASGTSLIAIMLLAIPGAIEHGILGNIDYVTGIATAIGTIPGAFAGARLVSRVPERTLRILFSILLAIGAILLVLREIAF